MRVETPAAKPDVSAAAATPRTGERAAAAPRLLFIDNVRWVMIVLVLSMHAAVTYSPVGSWYYREHPKLGPLSTLFFVTYQGALQGFFMALLFFIAGYFTPRSFEAKGPAGFMAGRLYRLGLPTAFYVFLLGPVTEYFVARSWHTPNSFPREMTVYYLGRGRFLSGTGPMWFCAALIIFCAAYVAWRRVAPARSAPTPKLTAAGLAATLAALAVSTFLVRLVFPLGSSVFNMQLAYFPSYILMFALGTVASRARWLEDASPRFALGAAGVCVGVAMAMWLPLLLLGGALTGGSHAYGGGLTWQSAGVSLWEALICLGMSLGVLAGFRAWASGQGRLSRHMSDNAFAVYVIHPPILIGIAMAMAPLAWPALAKFGVLWLLSVVACFAIAAPLARRLPLLGRIL